MQGLTARLSKGLFSRGALPAATVKATFARGRWKGKRGGQRRGSAVDAQLTTLANGSRRKATSPKLLCLTQSALDAFKQRGYRLVCGQRGVASDRHSLGTALDLICIDQDNVLVLVELKCGYDGDRMRPVLYRGKVQHFKPPLGRVVDCAYHRHIAQSAIGGYLFGTETKLRHDLESHGITNTRSEVCYVNDAGVEFVDVDAWWLNKVPSLLKVM